MVPTVRGAVMRTTPPDAGPKFTNCPTPLGEMPVDHLLGSDQESPSPPDQVAPAGGVTCDQARSMRSSSTWMPRAIAVFPCRRMKLTAASMSLPPVWLAVGGGGVAAPRLALPGLIHSDDTSSFEPGFSV